MVFTWEIAQRILKAKADHQDDVSYVDADGHKVVIHLRDHHEESVDSDVL